MDLLTTRDDGADGFKFYHYDPSMAGAVIALLAFLVTTVVHFWQMFRHRCWFMLPMAIGGIFEIMGYGGRAKSSQESPNWTLGPYIIQAIMLLVAPALLAATIYMQLGRIIILLQAESRALLRKKWLTKIFVTGDVLSFFMQAGGGGYQSSGTLAAMDTGAKIIIGGLFVQLIFFGIFMVVAIKFNLAINRSPTAESQTHRVWRKHMLVLYIGSMFIMIRSIFRAIEYLQGNNGFILGHEAFLYIFDAVLMLTVMVLFNRIHPSEIAALIAADAHTQPYKMGGLPQHHYHGHERLVSG